MSKYKFNQQYYTPSQMKIPVDLEKVVEISEPSYIFNEIMSKVDLRKYLVVKGNKFGKTEELYQCEDCTGCPYREKCLKSKKNRTIRLNEELTSFHREVINNLECIYGALLRMNRRIQAEGTYGTIKWNREHTRARRRDLK